MKHLTCLSLVASIAALAACSRSSQGPIGGGGGGGNGASPDAGDDASDDGSGDNSTTTFAAALQGAQVVPVVATGSSGAATFVLQTDGVTLTYDITLSNVSGATAVNLHLGPPGENGGVIHSIAPVSDHMTGSIALDVPKGEPDALAADALYLDVQTQAHPAGEIRGQLLLPQSEIFVTTATGDQQQPPVASAYHAHGSFILNPDQGTIRYHVATDAVPTDVRLHRAIGALNGPVAYPLSPVAQTIDGVLSVSANDAADVENGRFYLNIITNAHAAGELRGQLIAPGETLFTGSLSGSKEVPPVSSQATGGSQFILSPNGDKLRYELVVSGVIPTGAELDNAPSGENGPNMYTLTLDQKGALGSTAVTVDDATKLSNANVYVNVRTASYASGELRSQLLKR